MFTLWKDTKLIWIHIIVLFIVSRLVLGFIGTTSFQYDQVASSRVSKTWKASIIKDHPKLQIWAEWDSEWYLKIAQKGYSDASPFNPKRYSTIGFFPLYPILISGLGFIIQDYFLAGMIISNVFLILAAFIFYQLTKTKFSEDTARRSLWYLFLFPTAYIFSAVYSESLMLFLSLACFYAAEKEKWWLAGLAGFFLSLTRPVGFLILIPLLWIYLQKRNFSWREIRFDLGYLALIPAGLLTFGFWSYVITGDFLAYAHVQQGAWLHRLTDPITPIWRALSGSNLDSYLNAWGIIIALLILIVGYKKIPFAYWLYGILLLLFVPVNGILAGSFRYLSVVFPLILILAVYGKSEKVNQALVLSLALIQGFFFVFWVAGFWFVV